MADAPEPDVATKSGPEDPAQTSEERLAWLRAHGVTVEMPEDRKMAPAAAPVADDGPKHCFKFVSVPCDDSQPCTTQEAAVDVSTPGDALKGYLKPMFADGAAVDASTLREQYAGTQAAGVSASALQSVSAQGSCEVYPLCRPGASNGHAGVYLYLDEVGMLKKLPPNNRCNALAKACGLDGLNFYGNMFIGRVRAAGFGGPGSGSPNLDFVAADMDSSAAWMRGAPSENVAFEQAMGKMRSEFKGSGFENVHVGDDADADDGKLKSAQDGKCYWLQTEDEVEVLVPLAGGAEVGAKSVSVSIMPRKIKVALKGVPESEVEVELLAAVRPDDSTWTITRDMEAAAGFSVGVSLLMEKVDTTKQWPQLSP